MPKPLTIREAALIKQDFDNRLPAYIRARNACHYGEITLRREGDIVIVEVQDQTTGQQVEVIRESVDSNFCHSVSEIGIKEIIERHRLAAQISKRKEAF
mgnify:CR=1 FL=1